MGVREFTGGMPTAEYMRHYRATHLERVRSNERKYATSAKARARTQAWRLANSERVREVNRVLQRKYRQRFKSYWGVSSKAIGNKAETYAIYLLEKAGYQVLHMGGHWPFDIMGRKDGVQYAFEVTTEYKKSLNAGKAHSNKRRVLNWFGWRYGVVFVKPDFSAYRIIVPESARQTMRVWNGHSPWQPETFMVPIPFRV